MSWASADNRQVFLKEYNRKMAEDYTELVEYLDKKFNKIEERFNGVDEKFVKIGTDFVGLKTQIFDLDEKITDLQENKADKKDISDLVGSVDSYSVKSDKYFQEMLMVSHKTDRHEKWLHEIAEKAEAKLEY